MSDPEPQKAPPALSAAKAALLQGRLKAALTHEQRADGIPRRAPGAPPAPLSFAQQRLWFLSQWDPASPLYNVPLARRLTGPLDLAALERALSGLTARHEALRTTVLVVDGEPYQKVWPAVPLQLPLTDLTAFPAEAREGEAARIAREDAQRPFDLVAGPVVRGRVLRLDREDHLLVLVVHHIAFDGWSANLLDRDMAELYKAAVSDRAPTLPPITVQYSDYAEWQRRHLSGTVLERGIAHWRDRLQGAPLLDLPLDKPRPSPRTNRGERVAFTLPEGTTQRLRAFCRAEAVTAFMPLLAAYEALLHAWTGQKDLAIGTPVAGRTRAETEPLLGFFVNTVVLRTDLSGDPTARQLLARVRDTCLTVYSHQDVPFEKLVEALQPVRDPARTPLFQAMFAHHVADTKEMRWGALAVAAQPVEAGVSKFDLGLYLTEGPRGFDASLEYSTDLFERATMERFAAQYPALLDAMVAQPEAPLSTIAPSPPRARPVPVADPVEVPQPVLPEASAMTPTEAALAELWKTLLGRPVHGVQDSFFHLGGHSLLAMKLAARIQTTFGVELGLPALFSAPTLREMALAIDAAKPKEGPARSIRPAARGQYRVGAASEGAKRE